eukprot:COSAG03_NODE_1511_length_3952_cov_10.484817_3_plen_66_part_00
MYKCMIYKYYDIYFLIIGNFIPNIIMVAKTTNGPATDIHIITIRSRQLRWPSATALRGRRTASLR